MESHNNNKKKELDSIALLSIYADVEDGDYDKQQPHQQNQLPVSSEPDPPRNNISNKNLTPLIVDYDATLSPETHEVESDGRGIVVFGADLDHMTSGGFQKQTSIGALTESAYVEEMVEASLEEPKDLDPLDKFLPPPPKIKCSDRLQEKIRDFLSPKKKKRKSFNTEVRTKKDYRNPNFLMQVVAHQDIDPIGTCFGKDVFNPHGYDKSDYYDEIEADMKRDVDMKEKEEKMKQKVGYVSGRSQLEMCIPMLKINMPNSGVSTMAVGGLHSVRSAVDTVVWDGRPKKKSKWDKATKTTRGRG